MNEFFEVVDKKALFHILENKSLYKSLMKSSSFEKTSIYKFSFATLQKYYNLLDTDGRIQVKYRQPDKNGRRFAVGSLSLQNFPRLIRGEIAGDMLDIDMINAHPNFLLSIAQQHNHDLPRLGEYLVYRDVIINEIISKNPEYTFDDVKEVLLATILGGEGSYKLNPTGWLQRFQIETKETLELVETWFPEVYKSKLGKFNPHGSTLSIALNRVENKLIEILVNYLRGVGIITDTATLTFDGMMVPNTIEPEVIVETHFPAIENLFKNAGYPVKLKLKPLTGFTIPVQDVAVSVDGDIVPVEPLSIIQYEWSGTIAEGRKNNYFYPDFLRELEQTTFASKSLAVEFIAKNVGKCISKITSPDIFMIQTSATECDGHPKITNLTYVNYIGKDRNGDEVILSTPFAELIKVPLIWNQIPKFDGVSFEAISENSSKLNLFTGMVGQFRQGFSLEDLEGKLAPILWHLRNIVCDKDGRAYDYLMDWIQTLVINPWERVGVSLLLKGRREGGGKTILLEDFIGRYVIGDQYCLFDSGLRRVSGRFNSCLQGKLFILLNELGEDEGSKAGREFLKSLITDRKITIESKNVDKQVSYDNNLWLAFTTNNENPIGHSASDRRYFVLECGEDLFKLGKVERNTYFDNLVKHFNQDNGDLFYTYLHMRERKNNLRNIYTTTAKMDMLLSSLKPADLWVQETYYGRIEDEFNITMRGFENISGGDMYSVFKSWTENQGYSNKYVMRMKTFITHLKSCEYIEEARVGNKRMYRAKVLKPAIVDEREEVE